MADNKIKIGLEIESNTKQETADAEKLRKSLEGAAKAASSIGGTRGSRAVAAGYQPAAMSGQEYGQARGSAGVTGASARDFANQAQGLGGLVRLYATWAANIYAVGAAYSALEKAAVSQRLITTAEKFGDVMGVSMSKIAKDIQQVTGYAVSLQEALQFATMGTSAGISPQQIKELTQIAKGAANALGRDANDSIKRVIQGTAKQEQEILDELGIFVKAKDAYAKYAKEFDIKGGAEALSAQQKVLAYANAVQEAGKKWKDFTDTPDPFSAFEAKAKEALFSILTEINKVFVPFLQYLTESSGAITSLIVLIGTKLTQKALPELGSAFRDALTFSAVANKAKIEKQFQDLNTQLNKATDELDGIAKRRESLLNSLGTPKAAAAAKYAEDLGGRSGASARVLTSVYGTEAKPVDITKYKSELDVQNAIASAMSTQVKEAANKQARLEKLISLGLIEKTSTEANVVLTEKSKQLSSAIYKDISQQTVVQTQLNKLKADEVLLMERAHVLESQMSKLDSGRTPTKPGTTGGSGMSGVMQSFSSSKDALIQGLSSASQASALFAKNMEGGLIKQITGFITTIPMLVKNIGLASLGFSGLGAAAATTGAVIGTVGATIGAAISLALGPVMIGITLWQLFGDKIKDILGITNEYTRAEEKLQEMQKSHLEALSTYANALTLIEKARNTDNLSAKDSLELVNREFTASSNFSNQLGEEIKKLEELRAARERIKDLKGVSLDKDGKEQFENTWAEVGYWYKLRNEAKKSGNDIYKQYETIAALVEAKARVERGDIKLTQEQRIAALDAYSVAILKAQKGMADASRDAAGLIQRQSEQVKSAGDVTVDDITKKLDKLFDKTKEFPNAAGIVNKTLLELVSGMQARISLISNTADLAPQALKTATDQLATMADATRLPAKSLEQYLSILAAINMYADMLSKKDISEETRKGISQGLSTLFQQLKDAQGVVNAGLASSSANKGSGQNIKLLKAGEDVRLKVFEASSEKELAIAKNTADTSLRILEIRERSGILISEHAKDQRLALIEASEKEQTDLINKNVDERQTISQQRIQDLTDIYLKNMGKVGSDKEKQSQLTEQYKDEVNKVTDALVKYNEQQQERLNAIDNTKLIRSVEIEAERVKKILEVTKALKDQTLAYKEYWAQVDLDRSSKQAQLVQDAKTATMSPREKAISNAAFDESKRQADLIRAQEKEVNKQNLEEIQNIDFSNFDILADKTDSARKQLDALKSNASTAVQEAASNAATSFDIGQYSDKINGFANVFENAFSNMADAIVEWAKTGKLSGKDFFNSLIADLARWEIKMQMAQLYQGLRPGIISLGTSLLGMPGLAKGGVYDAGLQTFAKGGTFTNSIVNSPTLFKFAQGTGLMGEAGPEAIMPLKRDSSGNLGVRGAGGANVDVVVNNYSNAEATTKETKDSRGNRRIEVVIGEAASGEMARPGSSTQGAMRSTYGLQPQLIRR